MKSDQIYSFMHYRFSECIKLCVSSNTQFNTVCREFYFPSKIFIFLQRLAVAVTSDSQRSLLSLDCFC